MISFQPAPQRDILTIYFKEYYSDEVYDQTILETSFPSKYSRELKHNSLTFIQSLYYDRLVTYKSTHSTPRYTYFDHRNADDTVLVT